MLLGLGVIKVLYISMIFVFFNTVKNTDAHLSIKLIWRCCIESCSAQLTPPEVSLVRLTLQD